MMTSNEAYRNSLRAQISALCATRHSLQNKVSVQSLKISMLEATIRSNELYIDQLENQ